MEFKTNYGPWALILGASEGTGRAFALTLAEQGLPSVLVARRQQPLNELVSEIQLEHGVSCLAASVDLGSPDALTGIQAACGERDIGLLICNAGADPNGSHFLDRELAHWQLVAQLNIATPLACVHHFGGKMRERQRGGIVIVGSGACYGGGAYMATYTGAKGFQLNFSESLWAELKNANVNVLHMVLGTTDTPAFRKLLAEKGKKPPKNLASPAAIASKTLTLLDKGPIYNWGQRVGLRAFFRRQRVKLISILSEKLVFGPHK